MGLFKPVGELCKGCKEGYLVERVNSKTKNTFLGCSEFPVCKFTKAGGENPAPVKVVTYFDNDYDYCADEDEGWGCDVDWGDLF